MESANYMISSAFYSDGPIRSISYHNEYEMIFVEDGEIDLYVGNKLYTAKKNCLILLANLEQQYLRLHSNVGWSRYCVFFRAPITDSFIRNPELLNLLKNHSDIFLHCIDVAPIRDFVIQTIKKIIACDSNAPYANDLVAAYLTELLVQLCRLYPNLQMSNLSNSCKSRVFAVQRYLDMHYNEQIKIADVCKQHYISNHYLTHQFKSLTGFSPKQYLTLLRLKYAAIMLHDTNMPVNEIALTCGFSDINNFCKQFKKEHNCTPSEFRGKL